jgi:biopolymer transport protein ExbD
MSDEKGLVAVAEMNVTPMLDVMLVLLVMFILLSIRYHTTVDGVLPVACAGVCAGSTPIVLEVLAGPTYRINKTAIQPDQLREELVGIYQGRPEKIIQIAGYPGASYQDIITAMDIARGAGVTVVGIAPRESYLQR